MKRYEKDVRYGHDYRLSKDTFNFGHGLYSVNIDIYVKQVLLRIIFCLTAASYSV